MIGLRDLGIGFRYSPRTLRPCNQVDCADFLRSRVSEPTQALLGCRKTQQCYKQRKPLPRRVRVFSRVLFLVGGLSAERGIAIRPLESVLPPPFTPISEAQPRGAAHVHRFSF